MVRYEKSILPDQSRTHLYIVLEVREKFVHKLIMRGGGGGGGGGGMQFRRNDHYCTEQSFDGNEIKCFIGHSSGSRII